MSDLSILLRESFEKYSPGEAESWRESVASGDIISLDGNALSASYLVMSKSPLDAGTESFIETTALFEMPVEVSVGAHMSQRTVGQEFSIEVVDTEALPPLTDLQILNISQSTTTLTINFALPHGLVPGKRIGVRGVADSRFNYPALVVDSIPSPTQITCTAGPGGTIPSVTAGPFTSGWVFVRPGLGYAKNGTNILFEAAASTTASFYCRSDAGDMLPTGTVLGAHGITAGSTASGQLANRAGTYSFIPTTEFKLLLKENRLQWSDTGIDGVAGFTNRLARTQVLPSYRGRYKLRVRAVNSKSMPVPVARIVSVTKTASATATIVFDAPHGLTTSDVIVAYGVRDQTNFANLTAATAIASIVNATTITVAWGSSATATSRGGYVARVNGGILMSSLGAIAQVVSSAAISTLADGTRVLTLVGNTTWAGTLIGDSVNLFGCMADSNGSNMGLDGAYKVRNMATTTLELVPIGATVLPADAVAVNCGGAIIRRTDLRLSWARISRYDRDIVEMQISPITDAYAALETVVVNSLSATVTEGTLLAPTPQSSVTAATTNATSVKTSAGTLFEATVSNTTAATMYLKMYNKATAPTVGTDVPLVTIPIPANSVICTEFGRVGKRFSLGIAFAVTAGIAATDTAAVGAGAQISMSYV